jgi:hypothetical protein
MSLNGMTGGSLAYEPEGREFEIPWAEILNLSNPSVRTRSWDLLSL